MEFMLDTLNLDEIKKKWARVLPLCWGNFEPNNCKKKEGDIDFF